MHWFIYVFSAVIASFVGIGDFFEPAVVFLLLLISFQGEHRP